MSQVKRAGGCACGAVRFEIAGPIGPVIGCHCQTCRRMSGHYFAAVRIESARLKLLQDNALKWFASSDIAERGFCAECGSSLFYRRLEGESVSVAAGALDDAADLELTDHIFIAEAGGYYPLDPQTSQHAGRDY